MKTRRRLSSLARALDLNVGRSADRGVLAETGKPCGPNN